MDDERATAVGPTVEAGGVEPRPRVARSTERRVARSRGGGPATIYDVALAAGVSHQTVTRYLNGFQGIRPATRERVEHALRELDYRPNLAARALTTGRSLRIGAVTHELDQFGPSKILQSAADAARDAGYVLDIVTVDPTRPELLEQSLDLLRMHSLAGVLMMSSTDEMTEAFSRAAFDVPVHIAAEPDDTSGPEASELTTFGFPALIDHLIGLGHERFIHVAGPRDWPAARNRTRAYTLAVESRGATSAAIIHGDWSARSGHAAMDHLARDLSGASAVIAANDQMAIGVMLALSERGLDVPGDISVTGVDDIAEAAYVSPPLTTLRVDFAAQGRAAFTTLLDKIADAEDAREPAQHAELVVRRSTGPARQAG